MVDSKLNIVVIDDNLKETDPFLIQLHRSFNDANIILKTNKDDGLEYILNNLNSKMIVLLDYDLGNRHTGTEVLLKIREKTSLLYVIIITAKSIYDINNTELVKYVNNNALAFADKTMDIIDKINLVKNAVHSLEVRIDCVLEQWINSHTEEEQKKPYLITASGKEYDLKSILIEIRQQTEFGKSMEHKILLLAVDLLTRGKKKIND